MTHRLTTTRGLTLLEVLMATAILAMLAAATAPLIARTVALLEREAIPQDTIVQSAELAAAAELFMHEPDGFGVNRDALHELERTEIAWPLDDEAAEGISHPSIVIRALRSADDEAEHCWLIFECQGLTLARWLALPKREGEEPSP